jgi:CHAT domain-containing protein/tetratricopeptide (TPR) repeat protein
VKRVDELENAIHSLWGDGKFDEAVEAARKALAICEKALGTDHWRTAGLRRMVKSLRMIAALPAEGRRAVASLPALDAAGKAAYDGARYEEAVNLARRALEICRRWMGERHPDTAQCYHNLALLLRDRGDLPRAEAMLRKALAILLEVVGEQHPDTAYNYSTLATVLHARGDLPGAEAMHSKALMIQLKMLAKHHPSTANSYNNLASVLSDRGDLPGAEALHRKALAIQIATLGESHPDTVLTYNDIALALYARGDLPGAEALLRKSLALMIATRGDRHPFTATTYGNLAVVLRARGKLSGAEAMARKALAIRIEALGERHPDTALSYDGLAVSLHARGDLPRAEGISRKALAILLKALGPRHPKIAKSYNLLADLLRERGDLAGAEVMVRKALAIHLEVLGERHLDTAESYNNLALVLHARGDLPGAEAMCRKALAIRIEALGEHQPDAAASFNNLAAVMLARGDLLGAQAMNHKALAIRLELLGERHPQTAQSYNNFAWVLCTCGELPRAEAMHRKALAIRLELLGGHHSDIVTSYAGLGLVLAGLGRTSEAIDVLEDAASGSSGTQKRSLGLQDAAAELPNPFPVLATLLARAGRPADAWNRWERGLSRALLGEVSGRAARPLTDDERQREAGLLDEAQACDERINLLLARGKPTPEVEKRLDALRGEASELRRGLLELQEQFDQKYGQLAGQPARLEAAQEMLDDASALVGWIDTNLSQWACIVRRSGDPIWVEIPGSGKDGAWTKDDKALAGRLRATLVSRSGNDWRSLAGAFARQRLVPLEPHLKDVKRVIVVNSPGLAGLPVEVLFRARTQARQAAPVVSYAPSASMFAYLASRKPAQPGPDTLLAVGDPHFASPKKPESLPAPPVHGVLVTHVEYDRKVPDGIERGDVVLSYRGYRITTPGSFRDTNLEIARKSRSNPASQPPPLRATVWREGRVKELVLDPHPRKLSIDERPVREAVAALRNSDQPIVASRAETWQRLPGTRREVKAVAGLFPHGRATTLLGDQARESVVQDMARSGKLKGFRYLHFATHGRDDPASAYHTALLFAPDLDRSADPLAVDADGEITAEQIARTWDLDAELVVLSACETALGKRAGGEGFLGFAQPLLAKGARSLVLSLWRVDDKATSLLMARFYQNLLGQRPGLSKPMLKALALHEAKEWLRNLTQDEVGNELAALDRGPERPLVKPSRPAAGEASSSSKPLGVRTYSHPYYWAAFILIGDPS